MVSAQTAFINTFAHTSKTVSGLTEVKSFGCKRSFLKRQEQRKSRFLWKEKKKECRVKSERKVRFVRKGWTGRERKEVETLSGAQCADWRPACSFFIGQMSHCAASLCSVVRLQPGLPIASFAQHTSASRRMWHACPYLYTRVCHSVWMTVNACDLCVRTEVGKLYFAAQKVGKLNFRWINPHLHP